MGRVPRWHRLRTLICLLPSDSTAEGVRFLFLEVTPTFSPQFEWQRTYLLASIHWVSERTACNVRTHSCFHPLESGTPRGCFLSQCTPSVTQWWPAWIFFPSPSTILPGNHVIIKCQWYFETLVDISSWNIVFVIFLLSPTWTNNTSFPREE